MPRTTSRKNKAPKSRKPRKLGRTTKALPARSLSGSSARRPRAARKPDPQRAYEDVYLKLIEVMDRAPKGPEVEIAVLDAVLTAAAHYAADSFTDEDAAAGTLKCMQLFAERMREVLIAQGEDDSARGSADDDLDDDAASGPLLPLSPGRA